MRINPITLLIGSSALYFFPILFGSYQYINDFGQRVINVYSNSVIIPVVAIFLLLGVAAIAYPRNAVDLKYKTDGVEELVIVVALLVFGSLAVANPASFAVSKQDLLEGTGRFQFLFYIFSTIGFAYSLITRRYSSILFLISTASTAFVIYIGHRSAFAAAFFITFYYIVRNRAWHEISKRHVAYALVTILILALYKSIYVSVKASDFDAVGYRLGSGQVFESLFVGLEQFIVFAHLDFVVDNNFRLSCSNMIYIPITLFPFTDTFLDIDGCGYNAQIQSAFFSGYSGGVAANIWAEFFANFGYAGIPAFIIVISLLIYFIEKAISNSESLILKIGLIYCIFHFAFYIQRKELLGAFISAKRVMIAALGLWILAYFIRTMTQIKKTI